MSEIRDLVPLLRAVDEALSRWSLSPEARERIGAHVAASTARRRRGASRLLLAGAGALAAAAVLWRLASGDGAAPPPLDAVRAAGFSWAGGRCAVAPRAAGLALDGSCHLRVDRIGMSIATRGATELVTVDDGVRLAAGSAEFSLAHRAPDRPVRVWVSAGAIEVTGTRFVVEQGRGGGHVELLSGSIRFRATDGTVTAIRPGTRFTWADRFASPPAGRVESPAPPDRVAPAPPDRVAPAPAPRVRRSGRALAPSRRADRAAADLIERVLALRAARRYRDAAELLARAHAQAWDPHTAEILSFEEGDLLERAGDEQVACAHWREHEARFPHGIYRDAVRAALDRSGCR